MMTDIGIGAVLPVLTIGPLSAARTEAYAKASGDRNPIHLDPTAASAAGLSGPAVHGMLLVAFMHEAVQRWRPDFSVTALSTRFLAPVLVGDRVIITGRIVEIGKAGIIVRLFLRDNLGKLAVLGEATVRNDLP